VFHNIYFSVGFYSEKLHSLVYKLLWELFSRDTNRQEFSIFV